MNIGITKTIEIGGKKISIETGKLAKQADGAVVLRMGDTMILATVVANKDAREGVDFLPLTVDYREKFAADGRIPGGFFRREARPSEREILVMRIVDRALRPLFPDDFHFLVLGSFPITLNFSISPSLQTSLIRAVFSQANSEI